MLNHYMTLKQIEAAETLEEAKAIAREVTELYEKAVADFPRRLAEREQLTTQIEENYESFADVLGPPIFTIGDALPIFMMCTKLVYSDLNLKKVLEMT